jgi:hypothetical protein
LTSRVVVVFGALDERAMTDWENVFSGERPVGFA